VYAVGFIGVHPVLDSVYLEYTTNSQNDFFFFFPFILDGRTSRSQMVLIKEEFAAVADCSFLPEFWSHGTIRGDTAEEAGFN